MNGNLCFDDKFLIDKEVLGKGAFATVVKGLDLKNNQHIACKIVSKQKLKENPTLDNLFAQEIQLQRQLKSPYIIQLYKVYSVDNYYMLMMEYCEGGDLEKYLQKNGPIPEQKAIGFLMQVLAGLREIHSHSIIHRDLKPQNIFIKGNQLKIGDFGCARTAFIDSLNVGKTTVGSSYFKAPEIIEGLEYGFEVDIFSLGVLLYKMLFNSYPFEGQSVQEIYKKMQSVSIDFKKNGVVISNQMIDFLQRLLKFDRNDRITWLQVYQHPVISKNLKNDSISAENIFAPQFIDVQLYQDPKFTNKKFSSIKVQSNLSTSGIAEENKQKSNVQQQDEEKKRMLAELKEAKEKEIQFAVKQYLLKRNIYGQMWELAKSFKKFNIPQIDSKIPALFILKKMKSLNSQLQNELNQRINIFNLKYFNDFLDSEPYEKLQKQINDDSVEIDKLLHPTQQEAIESIQKLNITDQDLIQEIKTLQLTPCFKKFYIESLIAYANGLNQILQKLNDTAQQKGFFYQIILVYEACSIDKLIIDNIEYDFEKHKLEIIHTNPEKYQSIIEQKQTEALN
ncbi:Serine/Threonine kinase domain protein (macronuclear) [Tetrahymena thermophila SB210]|uniref:Serine/Threonine kinase domain protein n=1 Tax=Tetrahymena thermophila (strain SB210) TaxID=312017 RepID=Q22N79_TETTS|nr:Serine/Threonine kinase domain protein [Tetrahymena thermophila SB210]EAR86906.1 Serine/Threonine kinase domain protein [Tetrahymena thermophila SB210]|eukprot:XP_001007151.1 Serine/Threonine kinase domain protein [Tetrahymena thermophila SB210]